MGGEYNLVYKSFYYLLLLSRKIYIVRCYLFFINITQGGLSLEKIYLFAEKDTSIRENALVELAYFEKIKQKEKILAVSFQIDNSLQEELDNYNHDRVKASERLERTPLFSDIFFWTIADNKIPMLASSFKNKGINATSAHLADYYRLNSNKAPDEVLVHVCLEKSVPELKGGLSRCGFDISTILIDYSR